MLILDVETVAWDAEEIGLCTLREQSSLKMGQCSILAEVALLIGMVYLSWDEWLDYLEDMSEVSWK